MSKFAKQFQCLNGPCAGRYIDAPATADFGDATAVPWTKASGSKAFAVYLVVEHQGQDGLMFIKSYDDAQDAAEKVQELSLVARVMRERAASESVPIDGMMDDLAPMRPLILTERNLS